MAVPTPAVSPYIWQDWDRGGQDQDKIQITVNFDNTSRQITGITVFRGENCQWRRFVLGLGDAGDPDSTTRTTPRFDPGTTQLGQGALNVLRNNGIQTIENFLGLQITATR